MKKHLILACVTLLVATVGTALGADRAFIWDATNGMRDLGTLGGDSYATAINDSGTVVGYYIPLDKFYEHGFIWTEATGMVDLGIPGGGDSIDAVSHPTAINSAVNVAGYGRQVDGRQVAFFWSPSGGFVTLGDRSCNCSNGNVAYAINDNDQVTGNLRTGGPDIIYHAFLWSPSMTQPRNLGTVDGAQYSVGYGINNLARIVGASLSTSDFTWQPMIWTKQRGMRLLGIKPKPDAIYTQAIAVNDAGEIIGYGFTSTDTFAFYKAPDTGFKFLQGLGGNENYVGGINQLGMIAGTSEIVEGTVHAVLWSSAPSAPQDLGTLAGGVGSSGGRGINNLGQVVGETYAP